MYKNYTTVLKKLEVKFEQAVVRGTTNPAPCCHAIWGFWGHVAISDAKSDVIFLLGDPDFLLRRRNFAPISLSYRDPILGDLGFLWVRPADSFTRIDPKLNQVVPWSLHSTPSLKISCKSVQPFSRNVANKETNKQTNKSLENNTPSG